MKKGYRLKTLLAVVFVFVLILSTIIFYPFDIAHAVLPIDYVKDVEGNGLDWWTADSYLGLNTLKNTVSAWKADTSYDFEYLKDNPVVIAVIDSGIDLEHELFTGKYDRNGRYQIGAVDKNGIGTYDVLLRDTLGNPIVKNTALGYKENDVTDDEKNKHGTHVSGIIATLIHKLDLEQYVKILPIKASKADNFTSDSVRNAINFAISKGAVAVNMSLSSEQEGFASIKYSNFHEKTVLVAAAGNDGKMVKRYPAALSNVIGVMNYREMDSGEQDLKLSSTSNYGTWKSGSSTIGYDLCAPGDKIYSARAKNDTSKYSDENFEKYKRLSGTSMASPIVAFGAALVTMKYKALAGKDGKSKSPVEIASLVRSASTSSLKKGGENYKVFNINELVGISWHEVDIKWENSSLANQRLGSIKSVSLTLNVLPKDDYGKGEVVWYADDEIIGNGFQISYTPSESVGTTMIKAIWSHSDSGGGGVLELEATTVLTVDYALVTNELVASLKLSTYNDIGQVNDLTNCLPGKVYSFEINNAQSLSADDLDEVKWYVNDEYMYIGPNFDFTPLEDGEYVIKFKIGNFSGQETVLKVNTPKADFEHKGELHIWTIVAASVIGAVVIVVASVILIRHLKNSKLDKM